MARTRTKGFRDNAVHIAGNSPLKLASGSESERILWESPCFYPIAPPPRIGPRFTDDISGVIQKKSMRCIWDEIFKKKSISKFCNMSQQELRERCNYRNSGGVKWRAKQIKRLTHKRNIWKCQADWNRGQLIRRRTRNLNALTGDSNNLWSTHLIIALCRMAMDLDSNLVYDDPSHLSSE